MRLQRAKFAPLGANKAYCLRTMRLYFFVYTIPLYHVFAAAAICCGCCLRLSLLLSLATAACGKVFRGKLPPTSEAWKALKALKIRDFQHFQPFPPLSSSPSGLDWICLYIYLFLFLFWNENRPRGREGEKGAVILSQTIDNYATTLPRQSVGRLSDSYDILSR